MPHPIEDIQEPPFISITTRVDLSGLEENMANRKIKEHDLSDCISVSHDKIVISDLGKFIKAPNSRLKRKVLGFLKDAVEDSKQDTMRFSKKFWIAFWVMIYGLVSYPVLKDGLFTKWGGEGLPPFAMDFFWLFSTIVILCVIEQKTSFLTDLKRKFNNLLDKLD